MVGNETDREEILCDNIMGRKTEKCPLLTLSKCSSQDSVFGSITQRVEESDPVLLKSDGYPTYHLANIVDDKTMR